MASQVFSEVCSKKKTKQQRISLQEYACSKVLNEIKRVWEESVFVQKQCGLGLPHVKLRLQLATCSDWLWNLEDVFKGVMTARSWRRKLYNYILVWNFVKELYSIIANVTTKINFNWVDKPGTYKRNSFHSCCFRQWNKKKIRKVCDIAFFCLKMLRLPNALGFSR